MEVWMYTYKTGIARSTMSRRTGAGYYTHTCPPQRSRTPRVRIARPGEGEYSIIITTEERSIAWRTVFSVNLNRDHIGIIDAITKASHPRLRICPGKICCQSE